MSTATRHFLFDLDDTLYPATTGLFRGVSSRIHAYIQEALGLEPEPARGLQRSYWKRYGTSLFGLMTEHGLDPKPFLREVHDVPVQDFLSPDPQLDRLLAGLPGPCHVFTNGSAEYASRVLTVLGVQGRFREVFDIEFFGFVPKPQPDPYERVQRHLGAAAERVVLIDDAALNLPPARRLGWRTAWLRNDREANGVEADVVLDRLSDLPAQLASLLEEAP